MRRARRPPRIDGEYQLSAIGSKTGLPTIPFSVSRCDNAGSALADASTVAPEDLVATDQIFPDRVGEIYNLAHAPSQRWYYAPRMTDDEVLLIKGWDSLDDGRARFTPHAAFNFPETREDAPARESIEVRTFVVIDQNP